MSDFKLKSSLYYAKKLNNICEENKNDDYFSSLIYLAFINEKLFNYSKSIEYYELCRNELIESEQNDKDWRIAYYGLRSALCQSELDIKKSIPLLKKALKTIKSDKFKDIVGERHMKFLNKAKEIIKDNKK